VWLGLLMAAVQVVERIVTVQLPAAPAAQPLPIRSTPSPGECSGFVGHTTDDDPLSDH